MVDYCGSLLIGAPKRTINKLQRNAAARVVSNTRKYDQGLSHLWRCELHWLDVVDRVQFRVCVQVYKCLHNMAPGYLSTLYQSVSSIPGRRHLCSARRGKLDFPCVNLARYGDGRLPMPVPHLGTLYLTVSRTLILHCKPSNAISRPFYFPHTGTLSTFEGPLQKLCYINPLLLLLLLLLLLYYITGE